MRKLERNEMKKLMGGVADGGNTTYCGGCDDYINPQHQSPTHEVVCISLNSNWSCINLGGQYGNALQCANTSTGVVALHECNVPHPWQD
ncbi:MAG: hypothetical protein IT248_12265 [Chitinophagaceae bacterium]|jgi:hypothetical protein|nr:hypothetical protein [Chitinophagaceae bacterium]HNL84725.1 hypothetical protein [Chitinophagales bacterium]